MMTFDVLNLKKAKVEELRAPLNSNQFKYRVLRDWEGMQHKLLLVYDYDDGTFTLGAINIVINI